MKITDILVREGSILDLVATGKDDLLAELAGALAAAEPALERDGLLTVLREREALQSTGIGEGVAIPHGKIAGLDRLRGTGVLSDKVRLSAIRAEWTRGLGAPRGRASYSLTRQKAARL